MCSEGGNKVSSNDGEVGGEGVWQDQGRVINDSCKNDSRMSRFKVAEDEGQSNDEEERAARVALCNSFPKGVLNGGVSVERAAWVSGEKNNGRFMEEKAEPRGEKRAVEGLDSSPNVSS